MCLQRLVLSIFLLFKEPLNLQEADLHSYVYYILRFALLRNFHSKCWAGGAARRINHLWLVTYDQRYPDTNQLATTSPFFFVLGIYFASFLVYYHTRINLQRMSLLHKLSFQWIKTQVSVNSTEYSLRQMQFLWPQHLPAQCRQRRVSSEQLQEQQRLTRVPESQKTPGSTHKAEQHKNPINHLPSSSNWSEFSQIIRVLIYLLLVRVFCCSFF